MNYAIISDIHGNLAALQRVLARINELECDRIICLGDVVGYGPFPNECCDIIQKHANICIIGNHDHAAVGATSTEYFNKFAKSALFWTSHELTPDNKNFLKALPEIASEEDLLFVHASPVEPLQWNYILSLYDAEDNFKAFEQQSCFIGHSHVPVIFSYEDGEFPTCEPGPQIKLYDGFRYIINVGSVGQPRDKNPKASFGVYDSESKRFRFERVSYNVQETQEAMREKNLPDFLIERLALGR